MNEHTNNTLKGSMNAISNVFSTNINTNSRPKFANSFRAEIDYDSDRDIDIHNSSLKVTKVNDFE